MAATLSSAAGSLSSLLKQTSIDDHEELLRAADSSLKTSKSDLEAQHVKIVALLKLDRFQDALRVLESGGDKLKERARIEWAYALYKAGDPAKAAEVAKDASDRGMKHVEAQANYRKEDFRKASEIYTNLATQRSEVENEEVDLRINNGAVDASLEWANLGHLVRNRKPGRSDLEAFETAYNAACGSIARAELGQAEILLKRSKDLCNALDDLSQEEKDAEILPITVQQIYVYTRLGRTEEAEKLSKDIKPENLTDSTSKHIARINTLAASTQLDNPFIVQRFISIPPESLKPDLPFGYQKNVMFRNEHAVSLLSQKFDGTVSSTRATVSSKPAPSLDPTINSLSALNAAAHAQNKLGKDALKLVLPELERRPNDVGLLLTIVQLYVVTNNYDSATILLESFLKRLEKSSSTSDLDVRYAPGLVGTIISLYSTRHQTVHLRKELAKAAKYWRHKSKANSNEPLPRSISHLLKSAGTALLYSSDAEDAELAKDIFTDLHSQDDQDRYVSAGLIAALANTSPSSITSDQLSTLTPLDRLTTSISASALEEAGVAKLAPAPSTTATKRPAPPPTRKAKKIKPSRMPKDFDPNKKPDPERWLPLKDRSTYRPKGKKGKAKAAMFSQGAVVDDVREKSVSRPATPVVADKGPGGGQKKAAAKKKGKGGKW